MHCPICDEDPALPFSVKEGRSLLICERCRHIWFEQLPTAGELSDYYAAEYTRVHSMDPLQESEAVYYRRHAKQLSIMVGGAMSIADIGCSIPVFLREARDESSRRIGVDWSAQADELGRQWGIEMMTPEDFLRSVPDASLDVLRFSHVLEHLPNPMDALEKQVGKVKLGGLVYITQPNFPVFRAEATKVDLHDSMWPSHLHFFNPLSAIAMVERARLRLIRFLTHHGDRECIENYGRFIDLVTAADRLQAVKQITVDYGTFSGWPFYAGMNMGIFARKAYF